MKKLLYIVPILLGMLLTSCYYGDIISLNDRVATLKSETIASIAEQSERIEKTIAQIETLNKALEEQIATLEAQIESGDASLSSDLVLLKQRAADLEQQLESLQDYLNTELASIEDWATATFATLEQQGALAEELSSLSEALEQSKIDTSAAIETAVEDLESSLKGWVNEQLTGYYTIAEIDAKLESLETTTTEGDAALQKEIDALKESLATQKTELTEAYTKAIEEAINTNNGVIDEKIAAEIAAVNEKIGALEERLGSLEERISAVEDAIEQMKALDIIFGNTDELACLAGASASADYTIVGGDEQTTVEAFGDGGWSADIVAESATAGKVVVTAPSEISKRGKVVVLATSGAGGVAMKSLYFDEGVLTGILDTYEVDWEACTLTVTLKTNLTYTVEIPAEAQEWISIAETTRATVRAETITLSIAENPEDMPTRSAVVKLIGEYGDVLQSFEVTQKLRPSSNPIVFADPYVKKVCVEKFDTNGDGELSELEASRVKSLNDLFGSYATVVKTFEELQYFTNLVAIGDGAFSGCTSLTSITIPDSVTKIGGSAFYDCRSLTNVTIPEGVTAIGNSTFSYCGSLTSITIPDGVTEIGYHAFYQCSSLTSITIPDSVIEIGYEAFWGCDSLENFEGKFASEDGRCWIVGGMLTYFAPAGLTEYTIPDGVTGIGDYAFDLCSSLTSVTIPDSVTKIGRSAFSSCSSLTSITIPDSVTKIGEWAFGWFSSLTSVYCKATTPPTGGYSMFAVNHSGRKIYVPAESVEAYKSAQYWSDYADDIVGYDFE